MKVFEGGRAREVSARNPTMGRNAGNKKIKEIKLKLKAQNERG